MKTPIAPSSTVKDVLLYGFAYLLWMVNILVCVMVVIQLRSTVNVFWIALGGDRYTLSLVNQVCLLLGGFVAFVYVMFLEGYYRESVIDRDKKNAKGDDGLTQHRNQVSHWLTQWGLDILLRRFTITTAIPFGVLIASLVALEVALRILP